MKLKASILLAILLSLPAAADPLDLEATWSAFDTGSDASLRGLYAVSESVAWASGSAGTVLRTVDGGETWKRLPVPGAEELDFRDVQAFDADRAVLLTAGQPARIYRTTDGGATFEQVHESAHETAFFDGMAFWDEQRGVVFSDPVDGQFLILTTADGGGSWQRVEPAKLPPARGCSSATTLASLGAQCLRLLHSAKGPPASSLSPSAMPTTASPSAATSATSSSGTA